MKGLSLLLILFPVVLFGQTRRKDIVDSISTAAAANSLQDISSVISKNRGARLENIDVSDSGEYVTLTVRVHVAEPVIIRVLPTLSVVRMQADDPVNPAMSTLSIPPIPPPVIKGETITALPPIPVAKFDLENAPVASAGAITEPPLPDPEVTEDISFLDPIQFRTEAAFAGKQDPMELAAIPEPEMVDDVALFPAIKLPITRTLVHRLDTLSVVIYEEKKMPVNEMHLSDEGYSLLEKLEGFSPELYSLKDGGFTIGFGFFIPYGEGKKWDKGLTWEEAEHLIREKVPSYEDQVKQYINVPLTQNEFDALTMLAYNLGGFSKATSIVRDVNGQDFEKLQHDWTRFVHSKAPGVTRGLMNRRRDELGVRIESDYQPERKIQILKIRN